MFGKLLRLKEKLKIFKEYLYKKILANLSFSVLAEETYFEGRHEPSYGFNSFIKTSMSVRETVCAISQR